MKTRNTCINEVPPIKDRWNFKAQMQMAETIAILLVFFIILGLSLMFYGGFQAGSLREAGREQFERESIRVALLVSHLPEVTCSDNNIITENCIDRVKLEALSVRADPKRGSEEVFLFYQKDFRSSMVKIEQVFPPIAGQMPFLLYNQTLENFTEMIPTFIPLTIRDPLKPAGFQNSFGLLTVEVYR